MMEHVIKPYVRADGIWSISDQTMAIIYYNMVHHKLDKALFKNGEVTDVTSWMNLCQNRNNVMHVIRSKRDYPADMVAWLNSWAYNSAFGHFCCFPQTWGTGEALELGKETLDFWFKTMKNDNWQLDAIFGKVPSNNKRAIDYVSKLGFRRLGEVKSIRYKDDKTSKGATFFVKERA